ncbi:MAG: hypothetical protein U1E73_10995 [Planctomycetota bacterium]
MKAITKATLAGLTLMTALAAAGCRSNQYRAPKGGVSVQDPCGLQITATDVRAGKRGFTATFDLVNDSDAGLLVPFTGLEADWGGQTAKVTVDERRVRKQFPCAGLKIPGAIDTGLFAETWWVTGQNGEPPRGEAIYIKPHSRVQQFTVTAAVPPQTGGSLTVRWPHVYAGDARGTIEATVANGVTWVMEAAASQKEN